MIVHDVEQGTDEWHDLRRGIVTASSVGQLLTVNAPPSTEFRCDTCESSAGDPCRSVTKSAAPLKNVHPARAEAARQSGLTVIEPARTPDANSLTMLLAAERITGWTEETFVSADMWRGIEDEPRARAEYARRYSAVQECGFITEDKWGYTIGYSPDGLVGDDGLIEIKSRRPKAQLATILADRVPAAHMAQLQCALLVTGRKWIDYVSYCGGMPLYVKQVHPQRDWFTAITAAAEAFEQSAADMQRRYAEATIEMTCTERVSEEITF
jgi:hypothetical protein